MRSQLDAELSRVQQTTNQEVIMIFRTALLFMCLAATAKAQTAIPKVGEPAPPLTLETILVPAQTPSPTWEALKGKAVVLEFWATWCAPCVEQIPHLNELVEKLAGKPIQFISITDESPDLISDFLKKRPISGMVALNPGKSQSKAYGVSGIPCTVLVDAKGIIAGITMPQMLNETVLGDLIDGKPIKVSNPMQFTNINLRGDSGGSADSNTALLDILVRPSSAGGSPSISMMPGSLKMTGTPLRYVMTNIYHVPVSRIVAGSWADESKYDIQMTVPRESQSHLNSLAQQALESALQINARKEMQERDVLTITAPHGRPSLFRDAVGTGSMMMFRDEKLAGTNVGMATFVSFLESSTKQLVVDETGLSGQYDFELRYDMKNPESILSAIKEQFGFEITSGKRSVEVLVVEKSSAK